MSSGEPRQYRVLEVLGQGGFGTVYRAELRLPGGFARDVALKVLSRPSEANPQQLARLRDEARLLGLVRHRALVNVDALVKLFDRWTVVMEYIDGVSLLALLRAEGPLPPSVAIQIVEEVASGLHAAYTATDREGRPLRLLHRDVKPSNVQLTKHGEVKLLDFGVARGELEGREASSGSLVYGSLPYLAPERLDLEDAHASDVFSLVLTLAQLMTGRQPEGPTADPAKHEDRIADVLAGIPGPPELLALLRSGLAWNPVDRPDARELGRGCRAVLSALPGGGAPHLVDWAAQHVAAVQQARQVERGEFSGMLVAEAQTTERHRQLAELLGVAIPTTFDDPVGSEVTFEVPRDEPPAVPPPADPAPRARGPTGPTLAPPFPSAKPARPRRRWWIAGIVAGLLVVVGASVALTFAFLAGSGAVVGAMLFAMTADAEQSCLQVAEGARKELDRNAVALEAAEAYLASWSDGCHDGSLGFWSSIVLLTATQNLAKDGVLDDDDVDQLDGQLRSFAGR